MFRVLFGLFTCDKQQTWLSLVDGTGHMKTMTTDTEQNVYLAEVFVLRDVASFRARSFVPRCGEQSSGIVLGQQVTCRCCRAVVSSLSCRCNDV